MEVKELGFLLQSKDRLDVTTSELVRHSHVLLMGVKAEPACELTS